VAATRRLAAIMFTDMVGFTAAAQTNEAAALKLRLEQEKLIRPLFAAHGGREIKSTGDGFLVEFDSALHATECAVNIQHSVYERNARADVPPLELRIGVHLGDVEQRGRDIFGDAVNVASRVAPCAVPGGVCISGPVFDQVRNKIPNRLEKLDPRKLKNVKLPLDIYSVALPWTSPRGAAESTGATRLAVLPFANISPDPHDEYFADGLTEELITVLSQLSGLQVIARTSVSQYKSTSKSIAQIGAELGVSSILEGSVRKAGNQLRVTVQLIDVDTEAHSWAKTYDRELDKVFAVQTEIAKLVAKHLKVDVAGAEQGRLNERSAVRPDSYIAYLKGRTLLHSDLPDALESAKAQFELAISLDSTHAAAHSGLADVLQLTGWRGSGVSRRKWAETTRRLAARAIELDPNIAEAHASLALIRWENFEWRAAEEEFKLALSLNPSYSLAHIWYAAFLEDEARADEALRELELAERADPLSPSNLFRVSELLVWTDRSDEALAKIQKLSQLEPSSRAYHFLLSRYHLARSERDLALKDLLRAEELEPDERWKVAYRAWYYVLSGKKAQLKDLLRREEALPESLPVTWVFAAMYAELGDLDECFRCLEKARKNHLIYVAAFRLSPRLEHVRRDPRFPALLKRMNLASSLA
jgi:adenylate cyclase